MEAFPFMFAKNGLGSEWSPVVVPSFVTDKEARKLLAVAQRGIQIAPGEAVRVAGDHSTLGVFDVVMRVLPSGLMDKAGRRADFHEGFVLRTRDPEFRLCKEHLDQAHEAMLPTFQEFWRTPDWSGRSFSDNVLDLSQTQSQTPLLKLHETSAANFRPSPSTPVGPHAERARDGGVGLISRARQTWNTPVGRGAIIGCVVATVAVGAFVLAEHRRRTSERTTATART